MRKIVLQVAVSLDGLIEGSKGEYDWCLTDQDYGMTEFSKRIDALFIGRKTFEMLKGQLFGTKKHYVFSDSMRSAPDGVEIIRSPIEEEVRRLKALPGKDIWLFGGADLTASLLQKDLVDEFVLAVHPIVLGAGKPLFKDIGVRVTGKLAEVNSYSSGLVMLHYNNVSIKQL